MADNALIYEVTFGSLAKEKERERRVKDGYRDKFFTSNSSVFNPPFPFLFLAANEFTPSQEFGRL